MKKEDLCDNCGFDIAIGKGPYKNYCFECGDEFKREDQAIATEMLDQNLWTVKQIKYHMKHNIKALEKTIQKLLQDSSKE